MAALNVATEVEVVFSSFPGDIIAESKIESVKDAPRIIAPTETSLHADSLNRARFRLEGQSDAECRHVHRIRRAPGSNLMRNTEAEVIQQPRREGVGFMRQIVLVGDGKCCVTIRN